jgi:hypothetical protein
VTLKPRWTHPLNFRLEDKAVLDAAILIGRNEGNSLTGVIRTALKEYVSSKLGQAPLIKIDDFFDGPINSSYDYKRILGPKDLETLTDQSVLHMARLIRARKEELESDLRRRGFYFRW